jgi:hypothetical protein
MIVGVVKEKEQIYEEYNVEKSMLQPTITNLSQRKHIHTPVIQVKFDDDIFN